MEDNEKPMDGEIEHGEHHMDGELREMGVGDKDDAPLSQAEIIAALRGE